VSRGRDGTRESRLAQHISQILTGVLARDGSHEGQPRSGQSAEYSARRRALARLPLYCGHDSWAGLLMSAQASSIHLLAIDDDLLLRDLYEELFTEAGFRVTVSPASVSLAEVRTLAPDLVLEDWPFPWHKPPPLLTTLRSEPATSVIPVIVATTAPMRLTMNLPDGGAMRLLAKPFDLDELLAIADNLLDEARSLTQRSQNLRRRLGKAQDRLRDLSS
jgi:CheY-like chemotaxis protein